MPDLHLLFAPREWARTGRAGLGWKVKFLPYTHCFYPPAANLLTSVFKVKLAKLLRTST